MNRFRITSKLRRDDFDTRWFLAPLSVVLLAMALMQLFGIDPVGHEAGAASAAKATMPGLSPEFPLVVDPVPVPADVALAAPAPAAEPAPVDVSELSTATEDNHVATF